MRSYSGLNVHIFGRYVMFWARRLPPPEPKIRRRLYFYENYLNEYKETHKVYITPRLRGGYFELGLNNKVNGLNIKSVASSEL